MRQALVLFLTVCLIAGLAFGVQADNQLLANRIAGSLSQQFPDRDFVVICDNGMVVLQGEAGSALEMQRALQAVSRMEGVKMVENKITIATAHSSATASSPQSHGAVIPAGIFENSGTQQSMLVSYNTEMTVDQRERLAPPVPSALQSPVVQTPTVSSPLPNMSPRAANLAPVQTAQGKASRGKISQMGLQNPFGENSFPSFSNEIIYEDANGNRITPGQMPAQVPYYNPPAQNGQVAQGAYARGPRDYSYQQDAQMCGQPNLPPYAWPSYAAHPNYAQVTYPKKYQPGCWPAIGPFYPYPQPPMEWRKVTLEWHDGSWWLDFDDGSCKGPFSPLFRERRCLK